MEPNKLIKLLIENKEKFGAPIDSIVVERKDIIEQRDFSQKTLHELRSCTKLLTAFSVGILIGGGNSR